MQTFNFNDFISKQKATSEPTDLGEILAFLPTLKGCGCWLAGGAIRRTLLNEKCSSDLDFFFSSEAHFTSFLDTLKSRAIKENDKSVIISDLDYSILSIKENENNVQVNIKLVKNNRIVPIQLIKVAYYSGPEEIIHSFDYTICQFVFDGENLFCGDTALWDLGRKRLVINKLTYPVASLRRLIKYTQQGFYACSGTLNDFLNKVIEEPDKIKEDMKYID